MTLAIVANPGAAPGQVDLAVTGAAHTGTNKYASDFDTPAAWDSSSVYAALDQVTYSGHLWSAVIGNVNQTPGASVATLQTMTNAGSDTPLGNTYAGQALVIGGSDLVDVASLAFNWSGTSSGTWRFGVQTGAGVPTSGTLDVGYVDIVNPSAVGGKVVATLPSPVTLQAGFTYVFAAVKIAGAGASGIQFRSRPSTNTPAATTDFMYWDGFTDNSMYFLPLVLSGPSYWTDLGATPSPQDGWTSGHGASPDPGVAGNQSVAGVKALLIGSVSHPLAFTDQYGARTVTGLTIGQVYRVTGSMRAARSGSPLMTLGVDGIGDADAQAVTTHDWSSFSYDFTATGTSHSIRAHPASSSGVATSGVYLWDVDVVLLASGALDACVIERQDANGAHFVRLAAGQDVDSSGDLSVTDNEAAITGFCGYTVRDGLGATASTSISIEDDSGAATPILSRVGLTSSVTVERIDGYDEEWQYAQLTTDVKAVIGKGSALVQSTDDYGWTKRQGTLTLYAPNYDQARAILATYTGGRLCLLRQPTYGSGFDLYHAAQAIRVRQGDFVARGDWLTGAEGPRWTWAVEVDYIETGWVEGDLGGREDWTWDALVASYLAWFDVAGAFATWADVASDNP